MTSLDEQDMQIIQLLRQNGRLTNQELADLVGLSASQCSRRRIQLEQAQWILGYQAQVSPRLHANEIMALLEVKLTSHEDEFSQRFVNLVKEESTIIDAYKTTGDADYSLKLVVDNLGKLNTLITELFNSRLISHIKTSVILARVKEAGVTISN